MDEAVKKSHDLIIIGAGPAGLAGGIKAKKMGLNVLILENKEIAGGIPEQCVHPGFGNFYFEEDLTGPEFSYKMKKKADRLDLECLTDAHVAKIKIISKLMKEIHAITPKGLLKIPTKAIIYATGAREKHIYETGITGDRVSGIYTAGETQTLMDVEGVMPGRKVAIIGSGDIGLIMARRFALEGAEVKGVFEMLPYPGGLTRNVSQCLRDFDIPLYTNQIVERIIGKRRVEKIVTSRIDEHHKPIAETREEIRCDTVALATGLVPYTKKLEELDVDIDPVTGSPIVNELLETNLPGIFVAGNVLIINDYVDYAANQGEQAARSAKTFIENNGTPSFDWIQIKRGRNISFVVPHYISGEKEVTLYARAKEPETNVKISFPEIGKEIEKPSVKPGDMIKTKLKDSDLQKPENEIKMEILK